MAGRLALVAADAHVGTVSRPEFLAGKYVHEYVATFRGTLFVKNADTSISSKDSESNSKTVGAGALRNVVTGDFATLKTWSDRP
jgi:hypothetical protein